MYTTCMACAIIQRGLERGNITQPAACAQCFTDFCWNGTVDSTTPSTALLAPSLMGAQVISGTGAGSTTSASASASSTAKSSARATFGFSSVSLVAVAMSIVTGLLIV